MFAFTMKGQGLNVLLNSFFGPVVNAARGVAAGVIGVVTGATGALAGAGVGAGAGAGVGTTFAFD